MENLKLFLNQLSKEELNVLYKLLSPKRAEIDSILSSFSKLMLPVGGILQKGKSYKEIMKMIAQKHNEEQDEQNRLIDFNPFNSESEIEKSLLINLYREELGKLSEAEIKELTFTMEEGGLNKNQITALTSVAALSAAQASGFAVYVLASSTVGAISGALGITLPFAFYTTLSSSISVIIGPLGFLVLGYGLYRSFRKIKSLEEAKRLLINTGLEVKNFTFGNQERGEVIFKYLASLRIVKTTELNSNIKKIEEEIENLKNHQSKKNSKLTETKKKVNQLNHEIEKQELKLKHMKEQMRDSNSAINSNESELKQIAAEIQIKNETIAGIKSKINDINN